MATTCKAKCGAIFLGKGVVDGHLSTEFLVNLIRNHDPKTLKEELEEGRCELLCSEAGLCVKSFKRDEGFESDTESTRSEEMFCEVKVVDDHVFKLATVGDDSSSANSSGSDSEESAGGGDVRVESSGMVRDTYMLRDIVVCHRESSHPRVVVWVIRNGGSELQTLMFECASEEGAKDLSRVFQEASRKLRLDKYKQSRHKTGDGKISNVVVSSSRTVDKPPPPSPVVMVRSVEDVTTPRPWSLVQHTDNSGVTHLEVETSDPSSLTSVASDDVSSIISLNAPNSGEVFKGGWERGRTRLMWEKELVFSGDGEKRKEIPNRQRQPALLLRKPPAQDMPKATNTPPTSHRYSHKKGPAPQPPPRRHPTNPNLMLVPTKSGHEPQHSPYPKESHVVRGKFLRVNVAATQHQHAVRGALVSRFVDFSDMNNNTNSVIPMYAVWRPPAEMHHTSRGREQNFNPEIRRRSRSKSPPRRPMAYRYIDAVTSPKLTGLSQKFKEISDAVMQKKSRNSGMPVSESPKPSDDSSHVSTIGDSSNLKPVIKKGRRGESTPETKRVTFNAYATVQMLEC